MAAALTLELPVNHHRLWRESLFRGANTHHVLEGVAAKPGGSDSDENPDSNQASMTTAELPADAGRRREGPAGADQSSTTDRTPILLLRLKPHRHLPWPGGPNRHK